MMLLVGRNQRLLNTAPRYTTLEKSIAMCKETDIIRDHRVAKD